MLYPTLVWNGPAEKHSVFLTFDDGPVAGVTDRILEILSQYRVRATFFCVGENIDRNPGLFRRLYQEGHVIGNHTQHHLNGWRISDEEYMDDFQKCAATIEANGYCSPVKLFRPPYGKIRRRIIPRIGITHKIIMWDVLSYDFSALPVKKLLKRCRKHVSAGSIIVFHDSQKTNSRTGLIIYQLLDYLIQEDYDFSTLDKLFLSN